MIQIFSKPYEKEHGERKLGLNRPGHEVDHSSPTSAKPKECVELHLNSPNTSSWRGA